VVSGRCSLEGVVSGVRSVLVTGAYGLLGSSLCRALSDRGDRVVALARHVRPHSPLALDRAPIASVCGDVCDGSFVAETLGEHAVDTVVHLAAQVLVGEAMLTPVSTFEVNVRGTWTVLEACRRHGVTRVVVASTDKVYGAGGQLPFHEGMPLYPRFPYESSKAAADLIARSYWESFGLPVAVTRFANIYGGGDLNPSRLIPEVIAAVLEDRRPVLRSDGRDERDYLHVDDAVSAYLAILAALDATLVDGGSGVGACGEAFNAGTGQAHSVLDIVSLVGRLSGREVSPEIRGPGTPRGEISRLLVDSSKLQRLTGWSPAVGLEEGLHRTIDWYRRHPRALTS